jgi:hypothetical protein
MCRGVYSRPVRARRDAWRALFALHHTHTCTCNRTRLHYALTVSCLLVAVLVHHPICSRDPLLTRPLRCTCGYCSKTRLQQQASELAGASQMCGQCGKRFYMLRNGLMEHVFCQEIGVVPMECTPAARLNGTVVRALARCFFQRKPDRPLAPSMVLSRLASHTPFSPSSHCCSVAHPSWLLTVI